MDPNELAQRGFRFALSLTHDAARAEDLLHDAWVSLLRGGGPWSVGYLYPTIRNRFIDLCRREGRIVFEPLDDGDDPPAPQVADEEFALRNGALAAALGELRPEERAAMYLSAVDGLTAAQIAELFGWSRGGVLSLVHRARAKLRASLNGHKEAGA
ncbi:MAG: RNA polymerase sigma factor [Planctomycetes bacterium]|nr:RNA polymerase sigma factor [Planctomycetota bacterium]